CVSQVHDGKEPSCNVWSLRRRFGWLCILPALALTASLQTVDANGSYEAAMQSASQSRQVPLPLIEAIAYVNSRWEWIPTPARDGGVGPMHVMPKQMAQAAQLSGHTESQIANDLNANLDAGAALLASSHTRTNDHASS